MGMGSQTICALFKLNHGDRYYPILRTPQYDAETRNASIESYIDYRRLGDLLRTGRFAKMRQMAHRSRNGYIAEDDIPPRSTDFGHIGVGIVGDFGQLPPVKDRLLTLWPIAGIPAGKLNLLRRRISKR